MDHLSKTATKSTSLNCKGGKRLSKSVFLAVAVPIALLAILCYVFRDQLMPSVLVEVGRVTLLEQDLNVHHAGDSVSEEMLFQASGWVEADPWAVNLTVKQSGIVEEVFVKEGETVTEGQVVARLDPLDMQLSLDVAVGKVNKAKAALVAQTNAFVAANKQVEAAQFSVQSVTARLISARETRDRYSRSVPDVVSINDYIQAKQLVAEFEAEEQEAGARLRAVAAQAVKAGAEISLAEASLSVAVKEREQAALALRRTVIHSTMDGIVLRRHVQPGDKRMLASDNPLSGIIAEIYSPSNLQVRVDVPISEAGRMEVGQPARIYTALLPGSIFTGRVTRIIGQADLQRNTLQAKVAIDFPDPRIRPEVLCRVEFWRSSSGGQGNLSSSGRHSLWIPTEALVSDAEKQDVWVFDPLNGRVQRRAVELGKTRRDGLQQVVSGLRANEQVVINGSGELTDGARVKVVK